MKKKINWSDVQYWIMFITLLVLIGYLIISGRAWT